MIRYNREWDWLDDASPQAPEQPTMGLLQPTMKIAASPAPSVASAPGIDWGNALDWGGAAGLVPTGRAAWDPDADVGRSARNNVLNQLANAQGAQWLRSLGYQGDPLATGQPDEFGSTTTSLSDDAANWLNGRGYSVGVGHVPGTSEGGRAEFWGLLDPNGKYAAGQPDPARTTSDTLMDQITPFLMMAGPFLSATGAIGAGAGEAAGAASGVADAAAPTLAASDSWLASLGSAWSPEALGLTGSITPGMSAAELASLSQALPSLGEVGAGLGAAGGLSTLGGGSSGVAPLGSAWSPEALGLTQAVTPGVSASELAGLSQALPGAVGPAASIGGSSSLSSADKAALYGNDGYGPGMTGAQTSAYDSVLGATGSKGVADAVANSSIGSSVVNGISDYLKPIADAVGGSSNLGSLLGGLLGAASSRSGATTQSRDPWGPAQPYLTGLLGDANALRQQLAQQPFTQRQTDAYNRGFALNDQAQAALPGLLGMAQPTTWQRQGAAPTRNIQIAPRLLG